jgi:hypothetical protein
MTIKGKSEGMSVSAHIRIPRVMCSPAISAFPESRTNIKRHRTEIALPTLGFLTADNM